MKHYRCKTITGGYEVISTDGPKPKAATCELPVREVERVDITVGWYDFRGKFYKNSKPKNYYFDRTTAKWKSPVPDPRPVYWLDGNKWKKNTPPPDVQVFPADIIIPTLTETAALNPAKDAAWQAGQDIKILEAAKKRAVERIDNEAYHLLEVGTVTYNSSDYGTGIEDTQNLTLMLNASHSGLVLTNGFVLTDSGGSRVSFLSAELDEVAKLIIDFRSDIHTKTSGNKATILTMTDLSTVQNYVPVWD